MYARIKTNAIDIIADTDIAEAISVSLMPSSFISGTATAVQLPHTISRPLIQNNESYFTAANYKSAYLTQSANVGQKPTMGQRAIPAQ